MNDRNSVMISRNLEIKIALSKFLIVSGVFAALAGVTTQERILEVLEQRLTFHMIFEHALFFAIGSLSAILAEASLHLLLLLRKVERKRISKLAGYSWFYWSGLTRQIFSINKYRFVWPGIAIALLSFWHIPAMFNLATMVENIHILQHLFFVIVGSAGFLAIRILGDSFKIFLLIAIIGMMGFSGLLFSVLDGQVYSAYSMADHNDAGTYMIITSTLLLVIGLPLYLIRRTLFYVKATLAARDSDDNNIT
jgi:cytochrome c oxidase assembly factor CtaG